MKKYKNKSFPLYDKVAELVGDTLTTGANCFNAGGPIVQSDNNIAFSPTSQAPSPLIDLPPTDNKGQNDNKVYGQQMWFSP